MKNETIRNIVISDVRDDMTSENHETLSPSAKIESHVFTNKQSVFTVRNIVRRPYLRSFI